MSTITTRAGKGSPLTNNEVDANFTNLNDDKLENVSEDTTPQLGGDLDTNGNDIQFGDNDKATFGAGDDLQIYHDGSGSYISETGTGPLRLQGSGVRIVGTSGENLLIANEGAEVTLLHNNSAKLATTSSGVDVTGTLVSDGLTVDGDVEFNHTEANQAGQLYFDGLTGNAGNPVWNLQFRNTVSGVVTDEDAGSIRIDALNTRRRYDMIFATSNNGVEADRLAIDYNGNISFYEDTGTTAKLTWDASAETLKFQDNGTARFGTDNDFDIYHNGTNARVNNLTGHLILTQYADDKDIILTSDDGSGGTTDYIVADGSTGEVKLYHYGSEKLATKSTGIDVTGTVTADGATIDGEIILDSATGNHFLKFYRTDSTINAGNALGQILFGGSDDGDFPDAASIKASAVTNWTATNSGTQLDFYTTKNATVTPVKRLTIDDSGDISFYDDSSSSQDFYWDASTSRLGLGTTSPSHPLTTIGEKNSEIALFEYEGTFNDQRLRIVTGDDSPTNSKVFGIEHTYQSNFNNASVNFFRGGSSVGGFLTFDTNGSEAMRIDSGNVGIGTSSPEGNLHILNGSSGTITTSNSQLVIENNTTARLTLLTPNVSGGTIEFGDPDDQDAGRINYDHSGNFMRLYTAGTERMRLDSSGRLGIGTASPSSPLQVDRASTDGDIVTLSKDGSTVGSIGVRNGHPSFGNTNTGIELNDFNEAIQPFNTSTNSTRDAAIDLGIPNVRFKDLYLSGGVYLGGTTSDNLLDDYEEGTFTPEISQGFTGVTYSTTSGSYTKVGRLVTIQIRLQITAGTTTGDRLQINGLPFTPVVSNGSIEEGSASIGYWNAGVTDATIYIGTAGLGFYESTGSSLTGTEINDTTWTIHLSGSYTA